MPLVKYFLVALLVSFGFTSRSVAQLSGGTISGTISDASEAVVPGATIEIQSSTTNEARTLRSNGHGFFSAPDLAPSGYVVTIQARGFASVREQVTVEVGQEAVLNVKLKIGEAAQSVDVSATPPAVDLATSAVGATVEGGTIRELPLNGRDWTQLATLEPGVKSVTQTALVAGSNGRENRGLGTELTVSGNRPEQNNYRLNGISINDYSGSGPGSVLGGNVGVDAIQEFSVVTSTSPAEYGKTSGGVFNAVTRTGTNTFHGSAYEFIRNSALDARNYFDGPTPPPFKRNQFGASAGGRVPKLKMFAFGDYEGLRQRLSSTTLLTVPSRAARSGQLAAGAVTVAPAVLPYLAIFPLANGGENGDYGTYTYTGKFPTNQDFYTFRLDRRFSDADSIFGTFLHDDSNLTGPDTYNTYLSSLVSQRRLVSLEETHTFRQNLINFLRIGLNRAIAVGPTPGQTLNPVVSNTSLGFLPGQAVGTITVSGVSNFTGGPGSQGQDTYHYNSYQIYDDIYYVLGSHSLKTGVAIERIQANQFSPGSASNGLFTFGSLVAFLTDVPNTFTSQVPGPVSPVDIRQTVLGAYVQDDWRMRKNLTSNIGLRYEMATVPTEVANRLATLPTLDAPAPKLGSPFFSNPTLLDFSPRAGFSWDPFSRGKTAVRGAFGLYDTLPLTYQFNLLTLLTSPFFTQGNTTAPPKGSFPTGAFNLLTPTTARVSYVQQDPHRSYVEQWNFNIQQEILTGLTLQVGYTGSHGIRQPFKSQDADIVLPSFTSRGYMWPIPRGSGKVVNPNVGLINALAWNASSTYHALMLHVTEQLTKWVRLGASYTWSKNLDTGSSSVIGSQFANSVGGLPLFYPGIRRGLSDFDVRHNFVLNYRWELPTAKDAGYFGPAINGWEVGGIFQAASGQPFSVLVGGDPLGLNSTQPFDFPDRLRIPGCDSLVNPGNAPQYFKPTCFAAPNPTTLLGNNRRNSIIGPGVTELDASLNKRTHINWRESTEFQFRAEVFNLLNHPNFNPPSGSNLQVFNQNFARLSSAGQLTSTSTTSRQIQFGLKMIW